MSTDSWWITNGRPCFAQAPGDRETGNAGVTSLRVDGSVIDVFVDDEVPALLIDPSTGQIVDGNERACTYYGYTGDQLRTLKIWDINIAPPDRVRGAVARADSQKQRRFEFQHRLASGVIREVEVHSGPIAIHGRRYLLSYVRDITDQNATERQSQEREVRYRDLFNQMVAGFALHEIICDGSGRPIDYRFLDVNPAFESMTGLRREDLIGRTVREVMPQTEDHWIASYGEVALTGRQIRFTNFSGAFARHFEVVAYSPRLGQFAVTFTDATERIEAEQALRDSEERLRQTIKNTSAGYFRLDDQCCFSAVNRAWLDMHGYSSTSEILGQGFAITQTKNSLDKAQEIVHRLFAGETFSSGEFSRLRRDGSVGHHQFSAHPIVQGGRVVGAEGFLIDVTEQRAALEMVRADQVRLATLAELSKLSVSSMVAPEVFDLILNRSVEMTQSKLGYVYLYDEQTEILTNYAWSDDVKPRCVLTEKQATYELVKTGLWAEAIRQRRPIITNDYEAPSESRRGLPERHVGLYRHVSLPVFDGPRIVALIGVANKTEPYIEQDLQQLRQLMDGVWAIVERTRRDEALKRYNQRVATLQELDSQILAARSVAEIADLAVHQVRQLIPCARASVMSADRVHGTARVIAVSEDTPLGAPVGAETALSDDREPEYELRGPVRYIADISSVARPWASLSRLIARGVRSLLSAPLVASDQLLGSINLMSPVAGAFDAEHQTILAEIATQLAIGLQQSQLREELRRHNAELEKRVAERTQQLTELNSELDSFAYSVSHDLRAPLRALQGYSRILLEDDLEAEERLEFARRIDGAAQRMDSLVRDVLAFSRATRSTDETTSVDLSRAVDEAQRQIEAILSERPARITVDGDLPKVRANRVVLVQVIANLLSNAVKFVARDIVPEVRISAETLGQSVRLWVADNGIGIAPEHHGRVFTAFERLHGIEEYPGSGIGLAIVRKGIDRMNGNVGVESTYGAGSRFWIELPRG